MASDSALENLRIQLAQFARVRDWDQFHSPKNLSMALIGEAAELVEIFQWLTEAQSNALNATQQQAAKLELADIFIYLIRLADKLNVDLLAAALEKIAQNELRYPPDLFRGKALRADELNHSP